MSELTSFTHRLGPSLSWQNSHNNRQISCPHKPCHHKGSESALRPMPRRGRRQLDQKATLPVDDAERIVDQSGGTDAQYDNQYKFVNLHIVTFH
jgi:hypothetical protein